MRLSRSRVAVRTILRLVGDLVRLVAGAVRSRAQLSAENLFLRKQLALYMERQVKPRPRRRCDADHAGRHVVADRLAPSSHGRATRCADPLASQRCSAVFAVEIASTWPTSITGRPATPDRRDGVGESHMGEKRIASELLVKLGIHVSPRTVRRYMATSRSPRDGAPSQLWSTFVRNHASAVLACDFFVVVTARFRVCYVFVVLEVGSRRIRHWHVTEHPTAEWTAQQFRMVMSGDEPHRFVIHDHDRIYSDSVDRTIVLDVFVAHYNGHRPHRALALTPPCAARPPVSPPTEWGETRIHRRDRLGGVVHEYVLAA